MADFFRRAAHVGGGCYTITAFLPKPEKQWDLDTAFKARWETLRVCNYLKGETLLILQSKGGHFVEVIRWQSQESIASANKNPMFKLAYDAILASADEVPVGSIAEASETSPMFAVVSPETLGVVEQVATVTVRKNEQFKDGDVVRCLVKHAKSLFKKDFYVDPHIILMSASAGKCIVIEQWKSEDALARGRQDEEHSSTVSHIADYSHMEPLNAVQELMTHAATFQEIVS